MDHPDGHESPTDRAEQRTRVPNRSEGDLPPDRSNGDPSTDDPSITEEAELVAGLVTAPGLLLCLDFDGTLAPIVDDPATATIDPACRRAVARLAGRSNVHVAIVSGRELEDLYGRVDVEGVVYAGNHGLEVDRGDGRDVHPRATGSRAAIRAVCRAVGASLADLPGVLVEDKGVTATVHYRRVDPSDRDRVREAVLAAVADVDADLEVLDGKEILEVRPALDWDKGSVVAHLAADVPDEWATIYVGDDVTDEDAFEVVEPDGLGVHVGRDGATAASYRLPDRSSVCDFLTAVDRLVARRSDRWRHSDADPPT